MWILIFIYALMGSLLSMHLRIEKNWDVGDCLFAAFTWPIFLIYAYVNNKL